eukprot:COSAG02_NODE_24326_length_691_cov_4.256757_1_plen_96_part_00
MYYSNTYCGTVVRYRGIRIERQRSPTHGTGCIRYRTGTVHGGIQCTIRTVATLQHALMHGQTQNSPVRKKLSWKNPLRLLTNSTGTVGLYLPSGV